MGNAYRLKFLHNKNLGLSYTIIEKLITIDAFVERMMPYIDSDTEIDAALVYEVVSELYNSSYKSPSNKKKFIALYGEEKRKERSILRSVCKAMEKHMERNDTSNG